MTADEDGLEALLRLRYLQQLKRALSEFSGLLGLNETEALEHLDAVSRLFVRYDSFPAFSAWRTDVLRAELAETQRPEPHLPEATTPPQADSRLRAVQILGGERMTKAEFTRALAWSKANGKWLLGKDGKVQLTEEELQEALR